MRHRSLCAAALCVLILFGAAWTRAQQATPAGVSPTTIDDLLLAVRTDLQGTRADIIKKNVTFTSEQAAAFWPLFDSYQHEQNAIMDEQLKSIQRYIEGGHTVDARARWRS